MSFDWNLVYRDVRDSIFRVSLTPSDVEAHEDQLADLAEDADTVENEAELAELLIGTMISTGFAAGVYDGEIAIVTVAHSLEHLFRASRPITTDQINRLFTVQVLCGHYENDYLEAGGDLDAPRQYAAARVVRIDCSCDLMLVAANLNDVLSFEGGPCLAPHPIMGMCEGDFDPPTNECLMVSWPRCKPDTMSVGRISKVRRRDEISWPEGNNCEYDFDALEVQMTSGEAMSGAPLVNPRSKVIGMLHGGNSSHSYFVAFYHVRDFVPLVI